MKNLILYTTALFFLATAISCEKNDIAAPPAIDLTVEVEGVSVQAPDDKVTEQTGKRIDYTFTIRANATIAQVRTINSTILSSEVKTVDETITMGFTDQRTGQIVGTVYVATIGTEVAIVVTDTDGNEARRALTILPQN